ncbi:MAG: YlbL family protein [Nocardioides sp.]
MSRRILSSVVVMVLLVGLFVAAFFLPVPYVTMSPGPTVDVFAESDGKPAIQVEGATTYPTEGDLRLTTVSVTSPTRELTLLDAMAAWFDGTRAVYPRDVIYPPEQSVEDVERESSVQMVSSQDTVIAVALQELGYELQLINEVLGVTEGSPADGKLEPRDVILEVNGVKIADIAQVSEAVQKSAPGDEATFVVRRDGETRTVSMTTEESDDEKGKAVVGIEIGIGYDFPFDVKVRIDEAIGGPSAGLIFATAVYDTLTPGALTGGHDVAGTGTIDSAGKVGPIGGIQQKIVAAADAGAELFLVPPGNCRAALGAKVDDDEIRLVRAPTLHSAVESLETFAQDENADLPSCE